MSTGWTLGEIVSRATAALGNRTDISLSDGSFWANISQTDVWDAMPHDLQDKLAVSSTVSGENRLSLPDDFKELLNIRVGSGSGSVDVLQLINPDEIDSTHSATNPGVPTHYMPFGDFLELRPSPNSEYSIQVRYRAQLGTLVEVGDRLSVATRFGQAVFLKTTQLLADNVIRDFNSGAAFGDRYVRFMLQAVPDRALRQRERHDMGVSLPRRPK